MVSVVGLLLDVPSMVSVVGLRLGSAFVGLLLD
jgi:hypothetical protein